MSGLLIKDVRLLCQQKVYYLMVLAVSVFFVSSWDNCLFSVSYCTLSFSYFSLTTISYDELNQGLSFLFTLPVDRRGYAVEKYLFGFFLSVSGWLFSVLLAAGYIGLTGVTEFSAEWICTACLLLAVSCIFLSVMLPIQFKFGAEKSRMVTIILLLCGFGCAKMIEMLEKQGLWQELGVSFKPMAWMSELPPAVSIAAGIVLLALILVVSMRISVYIVEKKEF